MKRSIDDRLRSKILSLELRTANYSKSKKDNDFQIKFRIRPTLVREV